MITKKVRRVLRNAFKDGLLGRRPSYTFAAVCDENARVRATLDRATVDGKIGVILSGRDCDCVQYYSERVRDSWTSVAAFKRYWDQHCEWLDGPETQRFVRPDEIEPQHRTLDLALRAYEDGHPHVVTPVGYDELVPVG